MKSQKERREKIKKSKLKNIQKDIKWMKLKKKWNN